MSILRDENLVARIKAAGLVSGLSPMSDSDYYTYDSPVQPSSLDLHVGEIAVPSDSGKGQPLTISHGDYVLPAGNTAVIATAEELDIPKSVAGVGFPPSHLSGKGLLMTNPGHVDPGYKGKLHCTVINMSRSPIVLRCGDIVLTMVFHDLGAECKAGYQERKAAKQTAPPPVMNSVNVLSPDFLDVKKRAEKIANEAVKKSALYASVIAVLVTLLSQVVPYYLNERSSLKANVAVLQEQVKQMQTRLDKLEQAHR